MCSLFVKQQNSALGFIIVYLRLWSSSLISRELIRNVNSSNSLPSPQTCPTSNSTDRLREWEMAAGTYLISEQLLGQVLGPLGGSGWIGPPWKISIVYVTARGPVGVHELFLQPEAVLVFLEDMFILWYVLSTVVVLVSVSCTAEEAVLVPVVCVALGQCRCLWSIAAEGHVGVCSLSFHQRTCECLWSVLLMEAMMRLVVCADTMDHVEIYLLSMVYVATEGHVGVHDPCC